MSKRALRRWQQHLARVRKTRVLLANRCYFTCRHIGRVADGRYYYFWYYAENDRLHQPLKKLVMSPHRAEWNRTMHIRPARIASNQLERLIKMGRDPDTLHFPNYRKPHIYYW